MAKIKIQFNETEYDIDKTNISADIDNFRQHLTTSMNGDGATVQFENEMYNIDATKLSTATSEFISHLATIAGDDLVVVVDGIEYSIAADKISNAISEFDAHLTELASAEDPEPDNPDVPDEPELNVDPITGEILDSWEEIFAAIDDGSYGSRYYIGNYKPLDLGTEGVVNMQIAAFDSDVLSNGSGNAAITWIAKEILATQRSMNSTPTNKDGWAASEMRTYLSNDIYPLIPEAVRNAIVAVDKTYFDYTTKSTKTCSDKLWIPSEHEMNTYTSNEDSGVIYYKLFGHSEYNIKTFNGSAVSWWLRSADETYSSWFCGVNVEGNPGAAWSADIPDGIVISFCTGLGVGGENNSSVFYDVNLTINIPEAGTATLTAGGYDLNSLTGLTIITAKAIANKGYEFLGWYMDELLMSTDSPYKFSVYRATNIVARFGEAPVLPGVDPETGEIIDSWEQISAAINDGSYTTKYAVGNYKPLDLGAEGVVNMQIAAFDADVLSDGTGNAAITWIAKELLATKQRMNSTSTVKDSWVTSEMRTYLSTDIYALIPEVVRNSIVAVDKTYNDCLTISIKTCSDKLWIPSEHEVGFDTDLKDTGVTYSKLFPNNNSRIKTLNGSATWWWLRSTNQTDGEYFRGVSSTGANKGARGNELKGVALSFCMHSIG